MSDSILQTESIKETAALRLAGVTMAMVNAEMRWTLMEFLAETRIWRRVITLAPVAGQRDYELPIEDYESVKLLMSASYGDRNILRGLTFGLEQTGSPSGVGMITDRILRVSPTPTASETSLITVDVCLTILPIMDAEPPDEIRPYSQVLLDGLLGRLYAIPDKPWTDIRFAAAHYAAWRSGISTTRREMEMGRMHGYTMARFPRGGM